MFLYLHARYKYIYNIYICMYIYNIYIYLVASYFASFPTTVYNPFLIWNPLRSRDLVIYSFWGLHMGEAPRWLHHAPRWMAHYSSGFCLKIGPKNPMVTHHNLIIFPYISQWKCNVWRIANSQRNPFPQLCHADLWSLPQTDDSPDQSSYHQL